MRQDEVQDREHRLLDLTGIPGAADRHDAVGEVHQDGAVRRRAVERRIGLETRQVEDDEIRPEALEFLAPRPQEHVAGEEIVPGGLGDHPHADAMGGIGSRPAVAREQIAALGVADHAVVERAIALGRHRLVGLAPVDMAFGRGVLDEELVVRRAPGMHAGAHHERSAIGERTLTAADRLLVERGNRQVPVDVVEVFQAE